jgi:hypothetical protein
VAVSGVDADAAQALERARMRLAAGVAAPEGEGLPDRARRAVDLAQRTGAALLPALQSAADADADARRAVRAVDVACAQARTVAGGLLAAPLLLVPALGGMLGIDLVAFYTQPLGLAVAAGVLVLVAAGAALTMGLLRRVRRPAPPSPGRGPLLAVGAGLLVGWLVTWLLAPLVGILLARRARPAPDLPDIDEVADLLATALAGGLGGAQALRAVADVRPDVAAPLCRLALELDLGVDARPEAPVPLDRVADVLVTAAEVGAPVGAALRRLAVELRAEQLARALAAAERLPAQLTFPTALFLLPAVLLAIGAPLAHAGLLAAGA